MDSSATKDRRKPRRMLSIMTGNLLQGSGVVLAGVLLWLSTSVGSVPIRVVAMIAGYLLVYFSSHSLTHYLVGRAGGIKFTHYTIGGSSHPETFLPFIRPIFENAPFFAVHSQRDSLHSAQPFQKALMFGSGIIATALFSTLASLYAYRAHVPGSSGLLIFNLIWQISSLIAEAREHGDLGKAARAIRN